MTGFVDQFPHVRGQFADEGHRLASNGVDKAKFRRMERLPLKAQPLENMPYMAIAPSIDWISQ